MENSSQLQQKTRSEIIALLREYGISPTNQRIKIGQILFVRDQHLSAEQVITLANQNNYAVSKATVYNTLGLFADKGLLREVVVDPTKLFYDTNLDPHHHFYYPDTGTLVDVHADKIQIDSIPDLPDGASIEGVDVIIRLNRNAESTP